MTTLAEVLNRHIRLFNDGVRSGDFGPMTNYFVDIAEMRFEGIPVGPFRGREAIERAYAMQPPDDEIIVLDVKEEPARNIIICSMPGPRIQRSRLEN